MRRISLTGVVLSAALIGAAPALAQDADTYAAPDAYGAATTNQDDLVLELGIGGLVSPRFEGSEEYTFSPYPIIKLEYIRIPGLYETSREKSAIYFRPSFRYLGERDPSDERILRGLKHVDWALEAGFAVGYEAEYFDAFVAMRRGFGGHEGWVADLGVDGIYRPDNAWTFKLGPRLSLASEDYMDTYFKVSRRESIRSGYRTYDPSGGIKSVGLAATAEYKLTEETTLYGRASWDRLVSDAGDSPIVKAGDENMFGVGIGISYRFGLDLYD